MPHAAVVILNYNGKNYLEQFLPILIQNTGNAEIIVADNASADQSVSYLKKYHSSIRLIELETNFGFAGGYNEALKQVTADYFILLNSDVEVTPNWLNPLIYFLESNPDYAACQPKILDYNNKHLFEYAGAAGGLLDALGYPFCRGRVFNDLEEDHGQYDDELDIFWATGACMVIRSRVFIENGGFDGDFFAHMEEIDLCWRLKNKGWKVRFIPDSKVYHVGGGTLSQNNPFKTYLNFRNALLLIIKNLQLSTLWWKLPLRVGLDWVAAFKFSVSEGRGHAWAVLRAHGYVLVNLRKTIKKRESPKRGLLAHYSVVFKHFILRKRKYSEL